MRVPLRFVIALLLALEVVATVLVATWIGALWTFVWLAGAFLLGIVVMRRAGTQAFTALRGSVPPSGAVAGDTVLLFVAGLMLAIPGVLTDLAALVLLVPPTRHLVRGVIARSTSRRFAGFRSTITTVRLADGSIVIPGEVVEDDPRDPRPPRNPDGDPPELR